MADQRPSISVGPVAGSGTVAVLLTVAAHVSVPPEGIRFGKAEIDVVGIMLALLVVAVVALYSTVMAAKDAQIKQWRDLYQEARPIIQRSVSGLERSASVAAKAAERSEP